MTGARIVSLIIALVTLFSAGCKKTPPVAAQGPRSEEASFVGVGSIDGSPANILVVLVETDAGGYSSGFIGYRSVNSDFSEFSAPAASDTIRFGYSRGTTTYRGWALRHANGFTTNFTEPAGIPVFELNSEMGGYNLTGMWSGDMSSTVLEGQRVADMDMNQAGSLFLGEVDVTFTAPWTFQFNSGTTSAASFQLNGTVQTESGQYPALFSGNFSGPDVIVGLWQAGSESEIDYGEFQFTRSFN